MVRVGHGAAIGCQEAVAGAQDLVDQGGADVAVEISLDETGVTVVGPAELGERAEIGLLLDVGGMEIGEESMLEALEAMPSRSGSSRWKNFLRMAVSERARETAEALDCS